MSALEKAAMVLLGLGEEISSEIFKNLKQAEVSQIASTMQKLGRVESVKVDRALSEFYQLMQQQTVPTYSCSDFLRKSLEKSFNGGEAQSILSQLQEPLRLESLKLFSGIDLARILGSEHPQTMTVVIALCETQKGVEFLSHLSESLQVEVLIRLAELDGVEPSMLEEIDDFLRQAASSSHGGGGSSVGGSQQVAAILNALDGEARARVLDGLAERDQRIEAEVRELMFTFGDIVKLDDGNLQTVINSTKQEVLLLALRASTDAIRQKFLGNMSKKRAEHFLLDMESLPKVRLSDAEAAQAMIIQTVTELVEAGKITIPKEGDQWV